MSSRRLGLKICQNNVNDKTCLMNWKRLSFNQELVVLCLKKLAGKKRVISNECFPMRK